MKYNFIALVPEFFLMMTLLVAFFADVFREKATPKTYYTIGKYGIIFSALAVLIFYNQNFINGIYENNVSTTLFKLIMYVWALGCFYLSLKWFLGLDKMSFRFYSLGILSLLFLGVAISAYNLIIMFIALELAFLLTYWQMKTEADEALIARAARQFLWVAIFFMMISALAVGEIYFQVGSGDFAEIKAYLLKKGMNLRLYVAVFAIIVGVLFKIGIAPFHFWTAEVLEYVILPVSGYLTLVPIFAYYFCLVKLVTNVLAPIYVAFEPIIITFAVMSIVVGAIGANGEKNLRKMFAYVALFNMGLVLAAMSDFSLYGISSGLIYLLIYMLAMTGIYAAFYGFKSKGEYVYMLKDIAGISESKPFIAAAILIFMISMLGFPPLLGFLGLVAVVNDLMVQHSYWLIVVVMAGLLMMAYAYLNVIKTIYFDGKINSFDRADKGIYVCLLLNIILVVIMVFNPKYWSGLMGINW